PPLAQYRAPEVPEDGAGEVDAVNGAFMLVRRAALDEVGLLDEEYWVYMEDLDWCYRFKQHGWVVWYDGTRTVIHVKGGGTKRRAYRALVLGVISRTEFKLKYAGSVLGYLWSLAKPLMYFAVLWLVFGNLFHSGIRRYPLYLLVGIVLYTFVADAVTATIPSI